jgi:hypothetical protein
MLSKAVSCWAAVVRKYRSRQRRLERSASHGRARVAAACFIAWAAAAAATHRSPHTPPAFPPHAAPEAALAEAEARAAEVQQRCACAMLMYAWRQHTRYMCHVTTLLTHLVARVRRRITTQTLQAWHVYTRQLPRCSPSISPPLAFTFDTPAADPSPPPAATAVTTTTPSAVPFRPATRPPMPHTPGSDWRYADTESVIEPATHALRADGGGHTAAAAATATAESPYAAAMKREVHQVAMRLLSWMDGLSISKREVRLVPRGCKVWLVAVASSFCERAGWEKTNEGCGSAQAD